MAKWDRNEQFEDKNLNGMYDRGSSFNSYKTLFFETDFLRWILNSFLVSFVVTITGVVLASTSAYALSRFKFKGRDFGMISLLVTQMFPATMLLLPFCLAIKTIFNQLLFRINYYLFFYSLAILHLANERLL